MFRKILAVVAVAAAGVAFLLFYAFRVEPYRLTVQTHKIGEEGGEKLKIVQISDIQISDSYTASELWKLVEKVNGLDADIFLFTGDLYENYAQYGPEKDVVEALSDIQAGMGKYAIWGNRDYGGGCARSYQRIMEASGFTVLKNQGTVIQTEDENRIYLAGLDDYLLGEQDMSDIGREMEEDYAYRLLMLHEPDCADSYAGEGFDLMLAGHSHGGQVRLPFIKAYTTSMAEKYIRGFYQLEGTLLYVNTGIGTSHYPVRFGVVPEITVFELGLS